jgi:hypothetical protein
MENLASKLKKEMNLFFHIGYGDSYATVGENDKINMKLVNNSMALNEVVLLMHLSQKKSV